MGRDLEMVRKQIFHTSGERAHQAEGRASAFLQAQPCLWGSGKCEGPVWLRSRAVEGGDTIKSERSRGGMWTNKRSLDFILNKMKNCRRILNKSNMT